MGPVLFVGGVASTKHTLHFSVDDSGVQFVVFMQSTKCQVFYPSIFLMVTVILVCCLGILFRFIHCCVVQVELERGQPCHIKVRNT